MKKEKPHKCCKHVAAITQERDDLRRTIGAVLTLWEERIRDMAREEAEAVLLEARITT